jgi:ABC-type multidrug transport system ATPase subunit
MSGEEPVLLAEGLEVRYGKREVLSGVSLGVPAGSVFALLGRNGAGKSSLVRCALGMQKPRAGVARLFGENAWSSRRSAMERVGVVPEEPDAPPEMTAAEILDFCGSLYRVWNRQAAAARLARFDVPLDVTFARLSKGQKGAVMLALALAPEPELLILDDPTLGLDVVARRALYDELIGELADRGTTVFVTTHDLAGIEAIADRVAILHGTRLALDESVESLKRRFRRIRCGAATSDFSWAPFTVARAVEREWGREAVVTDFDEDRLARFGARPSIGDVEVGVLSLEEVFVAVADGQGGAS